MALLYTAWDVLNTLQTAVKNGKVEIMDDENVFFYLPTAVEHIISGTTQGMGTSQVDMLGAYGVYNEVKFAYLIVKASKSVFVLMMNPQRKVCGRAAMPTSHKWIIDELKERRDQHAARIAARSKPQTAAVRDTPV